MISLVLYQGPSGLAIYLQQIDHILHGPYVEYAQYFRDRYYAEERRVRKEYLEGETKVLYRECEALNSIRELAIRAHPVIGIKSKTSRMFTHIEQRNDVLCYRLGRVRSEIAVLVAREAGGEAEG